MAFRFPARLYPIVDTAGAPARTHVELAEAILGAGAMFLQLRVKGTSTRRFFEVATAVQERAAARGARLIINDRPDIALAVGAAGVHVGQGDLPPRDVRRIVGPHMIVGFSTHSLDQIAEAARTGGVDYVGFGPIYVTRSKENPDPVQGLDGLRRARQATDLPIVAIGGITAARMPEVLSAGADAVAMIGEIVSAPDPGAVVRRLLAD